MMTEIEDRLPSVDEWRRDFAAMPFSARERTVAELLKLFASYDEEDRARADIARLEAEEIAEKEARRERAAREQREREAVKARAAAEKEADAQRAAVLKGIRDALAEARRRSGG